MLIWQNYWALVNTTDEIAPEFPATSNAVAEIVTVPFGNVETFTVVAQDPAAPTFTVLLIIPLLPVILKDTLPPASPVPEMDNEAACV